MPSYAQIKVTGGDKWQKSLKHLQDIKKGLEVGFLEGAKRAGPKNFGMPVATYAFFNEYGTSRIPPRPFMRSTLEEKSASWGQMLAAALKGKAMDPGAIDVGLKNLGIKMKDDIVNKIANGNVPPPNAPSTQRRKRNEVVGGDSEPGESHIKGTLVDHGYMIKALDKNGYRLVNG